MDSNSQQETDALFAQALTFHQAGKLDEAQTLFTHILNATPDHADSLHLLGVIAHQSNNPAQAEKLIKHAIKQSPEEPLYLYNLGLVYQQNQQPDQATACFKKALQLVPSFIEALNSLGSILLAQEQFHEATQVFRDSLRLSPQQPGVMNDLGLAYHNLGNFDQAITCYQKALAFNPHFSSAYLNSGNALLLSQEISAAITAYKQAIQLDPQNALAHNNLGHAYAEIGSFDKAVACHNQALQLNPTYGEAYKKLGYAHQGLHNYLEGVANFRQALLLQPNDPDSHFDLGAALLLSGNFKEGWKEYEWRLQTGKISFEHFEKHAPRWDGTKLNGKSILLITEQGYGDVIQFARYIPMVADMGGEVTLLCSEDLVPLLRGMKAITHIASSVTSVRQFDVYYPLMSLPMLFGTEMKSIPQHVPYLTPEISKPAIPPLQKNLQNNNKRVGLVWAGNPKHTGDRHRSLSLEDMAPLLDAENVSFFSLQIGSSREKKYSQYEEKITDLSPWLHDFSDTASAIDSLDLIITVDTAVAHLAGAMGKPVWILLPLTPDWRWLTDRRDSPWYPSARLFRQSRFSDWKSVVREIKKSLDQFQQLHPQIKC